MTSQSVVFSSAKELLAALLDGHQLTPQELDDVRRDLKEGQYLDYKDGSITHKAERAKGRTIIREYVNGFANAEGGVLVVGVSDKTREISPCQRPGNTTLDRWAESLLLDMAPLLAPPPRFQVVKHLKGEEVLLIAVARAPQLVMEPESGQYFLRFHEATKAFPERLLTDLLLGRRQQPVLELVEVRPAVPFIHSQHPDKLQIDYYFMLENTGLVPAEEVEIGIVSWTHAEALPLNRQLLPHLQIIDAGTGWNLLHSVATHRGPGTLRLAPFRRNSVAISAKGYNIFLTGALNISAAVYVLAKFSPPLWFQVDFRCWRSPHRDPGDIFEDLRITRTLGRRPEVAIRNA